MASAVDIFQGAFGRAALLDMDRSLLAHAHPHCHVLVKISGADSERARPMALGDGARQFSPEFP